MKIAILFLTLLSIHRANAYEGKATMYGGNLDGNACGMDGTADSFGQENFVAIGSDQFDDGYGCGKCYKITCLGAYGSNPNCHCGPNPTITVQAIDMCPECAGARNGYTHFDLNDDALASITGSAAMAGLCGVVTVEYERIDCAISTNFYVKNKGGTSKWWYGLHLNDVNGAGGVSSVELYKDGSKVGYCTKNNGPSFFICTASSGEFPDPPLDIKITSDSGTSVTAEGCISSFDGGKIMQCNTNLAKGGGGTTPTTTKATTTTRNSGTTTTTTTTTTTSSGGGSGKKLKIANKNGLNQWWYAVTLDNIPSAGITWIKMRDSREGAWETGVKEWDYYKFNTNAPYKPPFSFKVKSGGQKITTYDVIDTLNEGDYGEMNTAFSAYTEEDNDNTSTFPVAAIIAIVLVLIIIIGVGAYCLIKRRKQKAAVSFKGSDNYAAGDTPTNKAGETKGAGYDMTTIDVDNQTTR